MAALTGQVVEYYTGRGVPGVLVTLGTASAVTDDNGFFAFYNMPQGSYTLQAIHKDFRTASQLLNLSQNLAYALQAPIKLMSVVRTL